MPLVVCVNKLGKQQQKWGNTISPKPKLAFETNMFFG